MNTSVKYLHRLLKLKVINYSIDSCNFLIHKNFKNIVFELSSFMCLMSIRNIMCDDAFFWLLRSSQFSYHLMKQSFQFYFSLGLYDSICFSFTFLLVQKKYFIQFFIFLWKLFLVFENHLKVSSFCNLSVFLFAINLWF